MTELDRATAQAIHACATAQRRAEALQRDLDRITQLLELNQVGRLTAIAATLAEHEHRLTQLEGK